MTRKSSRRKSGRDESVGKISLEASRLRTISDFIREEEMLGPEGLLKWLESFPQLRECWIVGANIVGETETAIEVVAKRIRKQKTLFVCFSTKVS